ncbi:MAG: hypothetical protein KDK70_15975 [Myxococcales bacterium]|nr:hypothetical protein [Myxococcales bacterium]
MQLVHETLTGTHLLHWLTVAMPIATLLVVSGSVHSRLAARLLLLGVVVTLATAGLASVGPGLSQVRYGAPLPMARMGLDPVTGDASTSITVLRTCFVANLLFWCSSAVLLGALTRSLARRLRLRWPRWACWARPARPTRPARS